MAAPQRSLPKISEATRKLSSPDPNERAAAFVQLEKAGALNAPDATEILLNLLDRENQLVESTLRESKEEFGVSSKYGEDYAEYLAALLGACSERCDKSSPRTALVLASATHTPSGDFFEEFVREYGKAVLPMMLEKARSDLSIFRTEAVQTLGAILLAHPTLTAPQKANIRNVVIAATRDDSIAVRYGAVQTLGCIGTASDVEVLSTLAERDSGRDVDAGVIRYPVREEARKAIEKIRQRAK